MPPHPSTHHHHTTHTHASSRPCPSLPACLQVIECHASLLRRVLRGCLLSRRVALLRALLGLRDAALSFVRLADRHLALDWGRLEDEADLAVAG